MKKTVSALHLAFFAISNASSSQSLVTTLSLKDLVSLDDRINKLAVM